MVVTGGRCGIDSLTVLIEGQRLGEGEEDAIAASLVGQGVGVGWGTLPEEILQGRRVGRGRLGIKMPLILSFRASGWFYGILIVVGVRERTVGWWGPHQPTFFLREALPGMVLNIM